MTSKVSPRSNSSSASSSSSNSRKIYNNFGRGQVVHDSRGRNVAEIGRWNHGGTVVANNDGRGLSWGSDKQAVDLSAGGRSKGIQPSNMQWRGQASFTPGETWKEQGATRGAWNQATRPQSQNVEHLQGSRFPGTSVGERRPWGKQPSSLIGQDASSTSEAMSSNHFAPPPSFSVPMGVVNGSSSQERNLSNWIPSSHEQPPRKGGNRGWESQSYTVASTNRRREGFHGKVSAVPELVSRDSFRHKDREEFSVRKVDNYGNTSSAGQVRNLKETLPFNSASTARGSGGYHAGEQEFDVRKVDTSGRALLAGQGRNFNNFIPSPSSSIAGRRGSYQESKQEFGTRKVDNDGSNFLSEQGRNFKETLSLTSASTARRSRGYQEGLQDYGVKTTDTDRQASVVGPGRSFKDSLRLTPASTAGRLIVHEKEAAAGQSSGAGESEQRVSRAEDYVLAPEGDQGSLSVSLESEGIVDEILPLVLGSCQDMCPADERDQRERLRDLAVFERLGGNPSKTSRELAVKKFCRTFSGTNLQPSDIRPLPVLWSTLQYLLNLLDDREFSFEVVHNFLFDRTRAIRQELSMQRIANSQAITMYEEIVRFHILSEHELSQRGSGKYASDSHLNLQQLSKALTSLLDLYNLKSDRTSENEPEFRAYYVLLNLGSLSRYQAEPLSLWFHQFPSAFLDVPELKFARKVLRCYRLGNFKAFFQLVLGATFLQCCLMELHFNDVRLKAVAAINQGGYKLHPIPLAHIAKLLLMKEGDLEEFCKICGLSTGMDNCRVRCLFAKQSQFSLPKEIPCYRCLCIVSKQGASYYEEVSGAKRKN